MKQYLEQRMYEPIQESEDLRVYQVGDLESLSASALYTDKLPKFSAGGAGFSLPKPIGSFSGFEPASNFNLGPGIIKETEFGYIERYLPPHEHKPLGEHINLGSYLPGKTKPFFNLHIDLNDD